MHRTPSCSGVTSVNAYVVLPMLVNFLPCLLSVTAFELQKGLDAGKIWRHFQNDDIEPFLFFRCLCDRNCRSVGTQKGADETKWRSRLHPIRILHAPLWQLVRIDNGFSPHFRQWFLQFWKGYANARGIWLLLPPTKYPANNYLCALGGCLNLTHSDGFWRPGANKLKWSLSKYVI